MVRTRGPFGYCAVFVNGCPPPRPREELTFAPVLKIDLGCKGDLKKKKNFYIHLQKGINETKKQQHNLDFFFKSYYYSTFESAGSIHRREDSLQNQTPASCKVK